jgi:hypothetical protein
LPLSDIPEVELPHLISLLPEVAVAVERMAVVVVALVVCKLERLL